MNRLKNDPMHPEKVTVWCGLKAGSIIGPYFLKDEANRYVSATVRRYPTFFAPNAKLDFHDMWFQQDGAICHIARVTMDFLRGEFGEHFIKRLEQVNWPLRSCDLTPLDYFLWDYVKAHVYTDKRASNDALEDNIEAFVREIQAEMMEKMPKFV